MSRPQARQCLAPGTYVAPGEVMVATEIGDPARGPLPCPAAPLVGAALERRGVRVRYGPVPRCAEASQTDDGAVLFLTSALQREGEATGIGAAADAVDGVAVAAARAAVEEWSAVVGTRRLLTAVSPWCHGAARALHQARQAVHSGGGPVHILGWLAASAQDRDELAEAGAVFATSLAGLPDGAVVFVPAHGVAPAVRDEAAKRGLTVIDATCPLVETVHTETRRFAERGDQIAIIGPSGHAVTAGIAGQAPGQTIVVESPVGAGSVGVADPRRVSYVLQPGVPVEETFGASAALRSRFPALRGPDPGGFCYAASDREGTIRAVATASDVVLVLGAEDAPDTRRLAALAREGHAKVYLVTAPSQIFPAWLAGVTTIGLAETVSARASLADEITAALAGLGPLSVTRRRVSTEILGGRVRAGIS